MRAHRFGFLGLALLLLTACTNGQSAPDSTRNVPPPTLLGKPVVLTAATLPPQGSNFRDASNRWQVHGVIDGATYRYGETDRTHIYVANGRGMGWTDLAASNSWSVSCATSGRDIHCLVESPHRAGQSGEFAVVDGTKCRPQTGTQTADAIILADGRICVPIAAAPASVNNFGFGQAISLRDWMIRIWKTSGAK